MANIFYTIEVTYDHDNERKLERVVNITGAKLKELREAVFSVGFAVTVSADHHIIISPWNIRTMDVWRQEKFFKA